MPVDCVPIPQLPDNALDARRTERVQIMRSINLRASDGHNFEAFCTDMNFSGLGVDSDYVLKVGQRVELLLRLKGKEGRVPMMVIYRMGRHYGLSALASHEELLALLPEQA